MGNFSKELHRIISAKFDENLLGEILRNTFNIPHVIITDITYDNQSKNGDSYLSVVTRFTVTVRDQEKDGLENQLKLPLIAKSLPTNIARRKTFRSLDFFANEVAFYNKVWPVLNQFQCSKVRQGIFNELPLCIAALTDGMNDYVILEDLSAKGYKNIERCTGLDFYHTQLILRCFARFHALSLAFKDQQPDKFEEMATALQETYFSEKFRGWYSSFQKGSIFKVIRDAISKQLPAFYLDKLNELLSKDVFGMLIEQCHTRGPLAVITHGDPWIPNFLIRYKGNDSPISACLIDFQLARYASLTLDVTFILYACIEHSLRLKYWDVFIQDYHATCVNTLEQLGSSRELMTLDDLKTEIKKCSIFAIGTSMEAIVMTLLESDETVDLNTIDGDEEVPLESVLIVHPFKSEEKRQRLANMFKHAVDMGFL